MCNCGRSNRRSRPRSNVPQTSRGTNQMLVQESQQQQQRERSLQNQIMAKNRPIINRR
jgi:hypothetical protein